MKLIPIVTYETGVDVHDFGVEVPSIEIRAIQHAVRGIAELPASTVRDRAYAAWLYARRTHTRERFTETFDALMREALARPSR